MKQKSVHRICLEEILQQSLSGIRILFFSLPADDAISTSFMFRVYFPKFKNFSWNIFFACFWFCFHKKFKYYWLDLVPCSLKIWVLPLPSSFFGPTPYKTHEKRDSIIPDKLCFVLFLKISFFHFNPGLPVFSYSAMDQWTES